MFDGVKGGLGAVSDLKFEQNGTNIAFDSAFGQVEAAPNFFVAGSLHNEAEDILLALGEGVQAGLFVVGYLVDETALGFGVKGWFAVGGGLDSP